MARQRKSPITSSPSESSQVVPTTVAVAIAASTSTSPSTTSSWTGAQIRQRIPLGKGAPSEDMPADDIPMSEHPLGDGSSDADGASLLTKNTGTRSQWIGLAIASGACAAFNGVFAKLATGELTSSISKGVAHFLHLSVAETFVNIVVRCIFFGLNLAFNGIMWALFTKALARGTSTTQVSIMNTSSNFVLTAVLGFAIFSEALPPLWWLGAGLLLAGNVVIGQKDESGSRKTTEARDGGHVESVGEAFRDVEDRDGSPLSHSSAAEDGSGAYRDADLTDRLMARQLEKEDDEDVLDLGEVEHR